MTRNLLDQETSPYLLQHKDNPVHWRPWSAQTLGEAEREDKPLLVSVGYAACHWCHVMAHESFEDPETAEIINELYIPVKVDREERPDIDSWLQTAAQISSQSGGWPLTVFLTPKGKPFWGGTYFPKEDSLGRPAFKTVLRDLAARFRNNPDAFEPTIRKITEVMDSAASEDRTGQMDPFLLERVSVATAQRFDIFFGGMTGAPKFPSVPSLKLIWCGYLRSGLSQYLQIVSTSLNAMCRGGFYDHVGGGFARYATDERWLFPHFEKMLYDNAELVGLLTLVWQNNRNPLYQTCVEDTIGWLLREMRVEGGGFASSLDADSEGEEGKYYTWTAAELDAALVGTMIPRFKQVYSVTSEGNFNGRNILHRFVSIPGLTAADEMLFTKQRSLLLEVRAKRMPPGRDDKVLADWNGMMIASLAKAGSAMNRSDWLAAAEKAFTFVCDRLGEGDKLFHTYRAGKRQHAGFSDDYANMARAALCLWEATGDKAYL
ncbi:MAG: thioredoxin domain-containing protein, partial [Proteobacteria bacterium]|nr:thioredoxin domain-containing protein [Pseudomonadota bacterium]